MTYPNALYAEIAEMRLQLAEADETIRQLRRNVESKVHALYGVAGLTYQEAKIVSIILEMGRAPWQRIYGALYDEQLEPRVRSNINKQVWYARRKLAPYGITIKTLRDVGYEMDSDSRAKLRELASTMELHHDAA